LFTISTNAAHKRDTDDRVLFI